MRKYRASIPEKKYSKINQPPFAGDGWPEVVGVPLDELAKQTSGIAGIPSLSSITHEQAFSIFAGASVLTFTLGRVWKPLYVGSAIFGALAAWKAVKAFRK